MSQARDIFYELLCKNIAGEGYELKKSKGEFEKVKGGIKYTIQFSWDGRGGTTFLNGLNGLVSLHDLTKATKKILAYEMQICIEQPKAIDKQKYILTQMYSRKLIELANGMKFKEMSAMPFEEKYPIENIKRVVEVVTSYIKNETIPFHNSLKYEQQLLDDYISKAKNKIDSQDYYNIAYYVFPIKLMCKKTGIEEPNFVKEINLFTNKSIDELWNIQDHDFDNMKEKFNKLKFKET